MAGLNRMAIGRGALLRLALLLACLSAGLVLSACTSPTSALAPSATSCFETIPIASEVLGDHGRLLGVRYLTLSTINADLRRENIRPLPTNGLHVDVHLCVLGYHGPFKRSAVQSPWPIGKRRGVDVLVIFSADRRHILHTVRVSKLPLRLGRI